MKKNLFIFLFFNLNLLNFNPIVFADESVSVAVPPRISDFQFNLNSSAPQPIHQGTDISYQITYGSNQSAGTPTTETIVANWGSASAPDNSQLLDYEIGSASKGYGDVSPIIDTTNKTITWTIYNLPAGTTDQTLTFKLKPITSYNKPNAFSFSINATMSNQYQTLPAQSLTQTYQYTTATSTPASTLTATPTIPLTPTPTPTSSPLALSFNNVSFTSVTDSGAIVQTSTNEPVKITIFYGTSPTNLIKKISNNRYALAQTTTIPALAPNTTYYFRILATIASGEVVSSDIFTFKTAKHSPLLNVENDIIILSSSGNVLDSNSQKENDLKNLSIILTNNTDYTISYALTNPIALKSIDVIVINKVLGTNTLSTSDALSEFIFPMTQKTPTLYVAALQTLPLGIYEVDVRLIDNNGNIIQKHISDLKIMPQLIVYGADTHRPLSDARIYLSYYDEQTKSYQPVTSTLFGNIKNPSYTDAFGESPITLPTGNYHIEESSLFYDPATQDFTIGPGINQNFPVMYLKREPFNLISLLTYTKDYFGDSWTKMLATIVDASSSVRIFHLVALEILGTFVFLTFFLFLFRSHLSLQHLPIFILFHFDFLLKNHAKPYIFGSIIDTQNNPITRVRIEIEDAGTNNILSHGSSHKSGKFYFTNTFTNPVNLIFTKEGYEPTNITIDEGTSIPAIGLTIKMIQGTVHHETIVSAFMIGLEEGFGMLFETFLVSSLLLEIFFSIFLKTQITLPFFFTLSLINILLWMFYLRERR